MPYFAGYAIWNYFNMPFFLAGPDFVTEQIDLWTNTDGMLPYPRERPGL